MLSDRRAGVFCREHRSMSHPDGSLRSKHPENISMGSCPHVEGCLRKKSIGANLYRTTSSGEVQGISQTRQMTSKINVVILNLELLLHTYPMISLT